METNVSDLNTHTPSIECRASLVEQVLVNVDHVGVEPHEQLLICQRRNHVVLVGPHDTVDNLFGNTGM
jgi:hypothetical protein